MSKEGDIEKQWHLDRRVPLALILTLVAQTFGFGWWASGLTTRVEALERHQLSTSTQGDRLVRLETQVQYLVDSINELKILLRRSAQNRGEGN